jgi:hypothetical protein
MLSAAAATAAVDPERLLWVPGRKLISIPRPRVIAPADGLRFMREFEGAWISRLDVLYYNPNSKELGARLSR